MNIQTNIGPYGREEGYLGESVPGRNIAAAPPGSGTFEIGAVIENSATVDRSGGALDSREQAEDRSRDSDGGGILELLKGLFGGGERSGGQAQTLVQLMVRNLDLVQVLVKYWAGNTQKKDGRRFGGRGEVTVVDSVGGTIWLLKF